MYYDQTVLSISRKWKGKYWMNRMSVTNAREKVKKMWDWNRGMMIFLWLKIEIWKTRWHSFLFLIYGKDGWPTARPCVFGLPFAQSHARCFCPFFWLWVQWGVRNFWLHCIIWFPKLKTFKILWNCSWTILFGFFFSPRRSSSTTTTTKFFGLRTFILM